METAPTPATKYVLILDDNEPLAGMLVSLLHDELPEHRFLPARTVEEAQLLASEFTMDLFILDINLPDGTGLDVIKQITSRYPIPAIAVSGFGNEEDIQRSLDAGFRMHITKPVNVTILRDAIDKLAG